MKAVVQRVKKASVTVEDEIIGSIEEGLMVLLGVHQDDTLKEIQWIADKLLKLRIFADDEGKMNRSVSEIKGSILLVSQFTLYGNLKKGTRPSFIEAADPEKAENLYDTMIQYLREKSELCIETGRFAAKMDVELINDGPVTIILQR